MADFEDEGRMIVESGDYDDESLSKWVGYADGDPESEIDIRVFDPDEIPDPFASAVLLRSAELPDVIEALPERADPEHLDEIRKRVKDVTPIVPPETDA